LLSQSHKNPSTHFSPISPLSRSSLTHFGHAYETLIDKKSKHNALLKLAGTITSGNNGANGVSLVVLLGLESYIFTTFRRVKTLQRFSLLQVFHESEWTCRSLLFHGKYFMKVKFGAMILVLSKLTLPLKDLD
jgi:hypothetical protein